MHRMLSLGELDKKLTIEMSLRSTLSSASPNTLPSSALAAILEDKLPPGQKDRQIF